MKHTKIYAFACLLILATAGMAGCGGKVGVNTGGGGVLGNGGGTTTFAPLTLTVVDPPTCASPRTTATHLFLSIAGVQMNADGSATATSSGWVDVAPSLTTTPKQIDMFNLSPTIGNLLTSSAATGSYGSLRLLLASNSSSVVANQCGSQGVNCLIDGPNTIPIAVAAETTQGIVINSASIAGSTIPIDMAGSNVNILIDSCGSLISNLGGYRLLPRVTAWGGGIQTYQVTVADSVSQAKLGGGRAIVALEKSDSSGVDRIIAQTALDVNGIATIYGPTGTIDLVGVATGVTGAANTMYSPLAVTGVSGAGGVTPITMFLTSQGVANPGSIQETVGSNTAIDVRLSVLQGATINGVQTQKFTIPLVSGLSGLFPTTTTAGASTCASAACQQGTLAVPSQPLYVQASGSTTSTVSSTPVAYTVFAEPFVTQGAGVKDCTTTAFGTSTDNLGGTISPLPGQISIATTLTFAGCQ